MDQPAFTDFDFLESRLWPHVSRQTLQKPEAGANACQRISRTVLLDEEMLHAGEKRRADDLFSVQDAFTQFCRRAVCCQVFKCTSRIRS